MRMNLKLMSIIVRGEDINSINVRRYMVNEEFELQRM
uniref:Uncharacterized protein n=1 Tax=viral metagenome TaxID=1070528 RepID=A0A6C0F8K8_9ZZZZ